LHAHPDFFLKPAAQPCVLNVQAEQDLYLLHQYATSVRKELILTSKVLIVKLAPQDMCNPRLAKLSVNFVPLENFGRLLLTWTWNFVKIVRVVGIKRRRDKHHVMLAKLVSIHFLVPTHATNVQWDSMDRVHFLIRWQEVVQLFIIRALDVLLDLFRKRGTRHAASVYRDSLQE
jgi:hypothetical protein